MPGMSPSPIDLTNVLIVSLFRHSLYVTSVLWFGSIAAAILIIVLATRRVFTFNMSGESAHEPVARTALRWTFGCFWLLAGVLQFQPSMPLGLANRVVAPMAAGTPSWLHSLMSQGVSLWNSHPVALAVGVAWLQVGIGLVLLTSSGRTGRWVGGLSALWAGLIWLIGNGAGGIFASGASIVFGWPGATLFYVVAGVWLFVGPDAFRARFSTHTTRFLSAILVVAAVLQCLPSAHFWRGGNANALTQMSSTMTLTAQPHALASVVRRVGIVSGQMGGGFNIVILLWLLASAIGLWLSVGRGWRWPVWALVIGCVFFWVVGEDTALFGGLATDVNSLLPLAGLAWCAAPHRGGRGSRARRLPMEMTSSAGAVVATFALAMITFALVTMGAASVASAENSLFLAQNGPATQTNSVAPHFTLMDQRGRQYSLGEHPGRVTLLTFLDPRCYTDCPLLANQLAQLRAELSPTAKIDIVAVAANPYHETPSDVRTFMKNHGLTRVRNFYFVTGALRDVKSAWDSYGVSVIMKPTDTMSVHADLMFIISGTGRLRWIIPDDPLSSSPGTASAVTELKVLLRGEGIR